MVAIDTQIKETLLTADEYLKMVDDRRTELIDGEVIEMAPSNKQNTVMAMWIGTLITLFVVQKRLGYPASASLAQSCSAC